MSKPFASRPACSPRRFQPTLELLTDRIVPAVSVTQNGGTLTVGGTSNDDLVIITDSGRIGIGSVIVQTKGRLFRSTETVDTIRVRMGDGSDRLNYTLIDTMTLNTTRNLDFEMGGGTVDKLRCSLNGNVTAGSFLNVQLKGGAGVDRITLDAETGTPGVSAGGNLTIRVQGGEDRDRIGVHFQGEVDGEVSVVADGGAWLDKVLLEVIADSGSTGIIMAQSLGGIGDDNVDLIASLSTFDPVTFRFRLDGGSGLDGGKHSSLVTVVNVERARQVG